ncbi:centrosomal protein of 97 kDa isoform X2 [Pieris brassicae]|uniref:centrosomal protein of 97 kDa isoform X2 n=1 Tax=Pieris brassicae TaxID=7116 RepID=UPI001E65E594|nr:centrosomal protein of 97 kDa isoform X2 [Pieris brassicae]
MDTAKDETLDLSRRRLKKIEKAPAEESKPIISLILDQNELQRLDNIDTYIRVENLSICNNFLLRMHGVSRLTNLRILSLNNNGILQIEGLKDMIYLKVLKLAGNNIKSIEHLNHNMHLEHLDLSNNQISFIADISYMKHLKHLNLERNRIMDLRQCDRYLPTQLSHLGLAHNNIPDLNEVSFLVHLAELDSFTIQGNPCVAMAGKDNLGFDYRPFVLNWILSVKSIDGFIVSAIESLKAEWLYSQGKGRHFQTGQHRELCEYLSSTCPLTADALETEDQRKLRLILSKAQHHQQQLKDQNHSPNRSKLQSPRMQARMTPRHMGRSPDRLSSSYHAAVSRTSSPAPHAPTHDLMSLSCSELSARDSSRERRDRQQQPPIQRHTQTKPANQPLEAASKMVPVPESLMSPDYQDPIYDIRRPRTELPESSASNASSQSSDGSAHEDKTGSRKGSPRLCKSASSSPKLKTKTEQRVGGAEAVTKIANGPTPADKSEAIKLASNQRHQKKASVENSAATTIQRVWRGYRSRNLNRDTVRILHAIQTARARQHIQRLTCDMEATKAALESERKIQQLQMQAINALWKKVSSLQAPDVHKPKVDLEDNADALRQLTETCGNLQAQVEELRGSVREVLRFVSSPRGLPRASQTDVTALVASQEELTNRLRRPRSLALNASSPLPDTSVQSYRLKFRLVKHYAKTPLKLFQRQNRGGLDTVRENGVDHRRPGAEREPADREGDRRRLMSSIRFSLTDVSGGEGDRVVRRPSTRRRSRGTRFFAYFFSCHIPKLRSEFVTRDSCDAFSVAIDAPKERTFYILTD